MRKEKMAVLAIILTAALMIGIMPAKIALADTYGMTGSGTAADPFIILNAQQLENITYVGLDAYYRLGNNIDCSYYGANWVPIGESNYFTGTLDGAGFKISGLCLGSSSSYAKEVNAGLFGELDGTVKNLDVTVTEYVSATSMNAGILAGYAGSNSTVTGCGVHGSVNASGSTAFIGGIIGIDYGTVNNSYSDATVYGGYGDVGGFLGRLYGTARNCYASGNVSAYTSPADSCGGFIGDLYDTPSTVIVNCYSTGNVSANGNNCDVGGFAGAYWLGSATLINCYSTGTATSSGSGAWTGGFIAYLEEPLDSPNYWNTSNCTAGYGYDNYSKDFAAQGLPSAAMQTVSFANTLNSNILAESLAGCAVWRQSSDINNGYPYLVGVGVGADTTPPTGSFSLSKSTWTCKPVTITVTATDAGSGVASIKRPDGTIVSAATATYTVTDNGTYNFTLADNAGNTCTYPVTVANIDRNVSVTHEQTVAYTIDPNSSSLSGGTITLTNNDPHIGVAVYVSNLVSNGIADVEPNSFDWSHLNAAQTKQNLAIGIQVIPAGGGVEPHCTGGAGLCQRHHQPGAPGCNQPGQHWVA